MRYRQLESLRAEYVNAILDAAAPDKCVEEATKFLMDLLVRTPAGSQAEVQVAAAAAAMNRGRT